MPFTVRNDGITKPRDAFRSVAPAIHHGTTVLLPSLKYLREEGWRQGGFVYGLHQNPTSQELGRQLCTIEAAEHCSLLPSGLSAINVVNQALLEPDIEVLVPRGLYRSNRRSIDWYAARMGISVVDYVSTQDAIDRLSGRTRLIWTECPASISMEVIDLPLLINAVSEIGDDRPLIVNDNSWSAGVFYQPLALGVDVVVQSLTKYQSGGADVFMGAILTNDQQLHERFEALRDTSGLGVSAHDAYLVIRGLGSLKTRLNAHQAAALLVAEWLRKQRAVDRVLHPAFAECPGHEVWLRDFTGASGVFSVQLKPHVTACHLERFIQRLQVFGFGLSWGGAQSLCMVYEECCHTQRPSSSPTLRLSVGLEEPEALIIDLNRALACMA